MRTFVRLQKIFLARVEKNLALGRLTARLRAVGRVKNHARCDLPYRAKIDGFVAVHPILCGFAAAPAMSMKASRGGSGRVSGRGIHIVWSAVPHRSILAVVLWMSGALLAFSATAIAVRALAPTFSIFEMLAVRNAAGVLILLALALVKPELRPGLEAAAVQAPPRAQRPAFRRTDGWAFGLTLLPLATVFALEFTTPAWVALLAIPLLNETMTRGRLVAVVLGFIGILIILRPGMETLQPASFLMLGVAFASLSWPSSPSASR